jgi:hypothetical protein
VSAGLAQAYMVKSDFLLNPLSTDPRFHQLLQRMHLPE